MLTFPPFASSSCFPINPLSPLNPLFPPQMRYQYGMTAFQVFLQLSPLDLTLKPFFCFCPSRSSDRLDGPSIAIDVATSLKRDLEVNPPPLFFSPLFPLGFGGLRKNGTSSPDAQFPLSLRLLFSIKTSFFISLPYPRHNSQSV